MAAILCLILIFLLSGQGLCQCFTNTGCEGSEVPGVLSDQRECCVEKGGLSFNDGICRPCIGMFLTV